MRIQTLKYAAAILDVLGDGQLTRDQLQAALKAREIEPTKDSLNNLLSDLLELNWIERAGDSCRIGLGLALIWKRALDAERRDAQTTIDRLERLKGDSQ